MFALLGVHGQAIYVDPSSRLVMVHTAVRKEPAASNEETVALWQSVVNALGGRADQAKKSVTVKLTSGNASGETVSPGPYSVTLV